MSWAPVAHSRDPSYSGGRDPEDCCSKLARANSSARPYLKNKTNKQKNHNKRAGGVAQGVGPEFKPR
jgi:hypothetical protein